MKKPCLDCGSLTRAGARCRRCQRSRYESPQYKAARRTILLTHRAQYGEWCPGWNTDPHFASASNPLTVDHTIALASSDTPDHTEMRVLCRSCNSRRQDAAEQGASHAPTPVVRGL